MRNRKRERERDRDRQRQTERQTERHIVGESFIWFYASLCLIFLFFIFLLLFAYYLDAIIVLVIN